MGVEFERSSTESHPLTNYKVQHLEFTHDFVHESFDITILNPDGKTFQLVLAYKNRFRNEMKVWTSPEMSTNIADWQLDRILN